MNFRKTFIAVVLGVLATAGILAGGYYLLAIVPAQHAQAKAAERELDAETESTVRELKQSDPKSPCNVLPEYGDYIACYNLKDVAAEKKFVAAHKH